MSRSGRIPINIPDNTEVTVENGIISAKGKLGQLSYDFNKNASEKEIIGLMKGLSIVAKKLGISSEVAQGYRTLSNISEHGGQEVPHLHFHIFGGESVGKMVQWVI